MLVTVEVVPPAVTDADAVMLVAPEESKLAASTKTEALPFASVDTVAAALVTVNAAAKDLSIPKNFATIAAASVSVNAAAGRLVNTTRLLSAVKVTTVLGIGVPLAFLSVAVAVTGVP